MTFIWRFRLLAIVSAAAGLVVFGADLAAGILRQSVSLIVFRETPLTRTTSPISSTEIAAKLAPLRSDIRADYALASVNQSFGSANLAQNDKAQDTLRDALSISPHNARMWSAYAALKAKRNPGDPEISDLLKLSYYTGPQDEKLIPLRLDIATFGDAASDTELRELARGDVRALLSEKISGGRQALSADYARASPVGANVLLETVQMMDPPFAEKLRQVGK
jgi:hypothetical protein